MLSEKLQGQIISLFDLSRPEYRDAFKYRPQSNEEKDETRKKVYEVSQLVNSLTESDHSVVANTNSIETIWRCTDILKHCMKPTASWHRGLTSYMVFQFLSHCEWVGDAPKYVDYTGWGPLIYDLSQEQLAYYLWWRSEAKKGRFQEATGEYIWLYIYDCLLNTCYSTPQQCLQALENIYEEYENIALNNSRKRLSKERLGLIIPNYALYNALKDDVERLINEYGFDDNYTIQKSLADGHYVGNEDYLINLASSTVLTGRFYSSEAYKVTKAIIGKVFEKIHSLANKCSIDLGSNFRGGYSSHVQWEPYDTPVLTMDVVKLTCKKGHFSFAINGNSYWYTEGEDLCSKPDAPSTTYSWYHNDKGTLFHKAGVYYRREYNGPADAIQRLIDYVIRRIQISYRSLYGGGRPLKDLYCPYYSMKLQIEDIVNKAVESYSEEEETYLEDSPNMTFEVLETDPNKFTWQFKYPVREDTEEALTNTQDEGAIIMADISKVRLLKARFEKLKNSYKPNKGSEVLDTLAEKIIGPTIDLDIEEGAQMWEYVLVHYHKICEPYDYHILTDRMFNNAEVANFIKLLKTHDNIKKYVFQLNPYDDYYTPADFIHEVILAEEYDLADELIDLYLSNTQKGQKPQENLYNLLKIATTSSESRWLMKSAGIDYLRKWLSKIKNEEKRAILEVNLLDLIDCVEGDAPKGAMTTRVLSELGIGALLEEKQRVSETKVETKTHTKSDFDAYMDRRDTLKETSYATSQATEIQHKTINTDNDALKSALEELNELIGLEEVKAEISGLTNLMQVQRMRIERGLKVPTTSQHLVFSGNPGTGKTTVARIIGKIYHALGFLSKGHLVEVDRSGLVAGYVGQTAIKTQDVINSASGGILFIDEAYSLCSDLQGDYGQEAIDTILKAMEDNRDDFVVIVAGYDNLMPQFIDSNPGLKSRFNKYIYFKDYNEIELYSIFELQLKKNDYIITDEAKQVVMAYFKKLYEKRDDNFGNARDVRNVFEKIIAKQANRIITLQHPSDEDIITITIDDIQSVIN